MFIFDKSVHRKLLTLCKRGPSLPKKGAILTNCGPAFQKSLQRWWDGYHLKRGSGSRDKGSGFMFELRVRITMGIRARVKVKKEFEFEIEFEFELSQR